LVARDPCLHGATRTHGDEDVLVVPGDEAPPKPVGLDRDQPHAPTEAADAIHGGQWFDGVDPVGSATEDEVVTDAEQPPVHVGPALAPGVTDGWSGGGDLR